MEPGSAGVLRSRHEESGCTTVTLGRGASAADDSPIGLAGRIVTATGGKKGPGEVQLRIRGGTETYIAHSSEPLSVGTSVIVLTTLGPRTVVVFPWTDPVDSLLEL